MISAQAIGDSVSGVLVDVFYDHFLARNWGRYHPDGSLTDFSRRTYDVLERREESLTQRFRRVLPMMAQHDWLASYERLEAIDTALRGISRRLTRANPIAEGGEALREQYGELEGDFHAFFPELEAFVAAQTAARA